MVAGCQNGLSVACPFIYLPLDRGLDKPYLLPISAIHSCQRATVSKKIQGSVHTQVSRHASDRLVEGLVVYNRATIGFPGSQIGFSHSLS